MKIFLFLLQNLPAIIQAVVGIEAAVHGAPGATKKSLVMASLAIAAKAGEKIPDDHIAAVSALVDSVVSGLNSAGVFTTKTSTAPNALSAFTKPPA